MKEVHIRRGLLMKALYMAYPRPMSDRALSLLLLELGYSPAVLKKDLEYLHAKGYVETEEKELEIMGSKMTFAKLTATGVEIVEGTQKDKGIVIPNGETQ